MKRQPKHKKSSGKAHEQLKDLAEAAKKKPPAKGIDGRPIFAKPSQ